MYPQAEALSKLFKALSDPNRLGIIFCIGKEARSVTEIIDITGLQQTLVSFHLKVLRSAGVVITERHGPFIYYSLADPGLLDIMADFEKAIKPG